MTDLELAMLAKGIAPVVAELVEKSLAGILGRVSALEQRQAIPGRDGRDGVNAKGETGDRGPMGPEGLVGPVGPMGPEGPSGKDGVDAKSYDEDVQRLSVELAEVKTMIDGHITSLKAHVQDRVDEAIATVKVKDGRDGVDGKSVSIEDLTPFLESLVHQAVATIPTPKNGQNGVDGKSVNIEDVAPIVAAAVKHAVSELPTPKDPIGFKSALIDRDGRLVFSFTDGSMQDVGVVVGKNVDPADVARLVVEEVNKMPRPKDGEPGRDGTLENLVVAYDGERTATWQFKNGDPVPGGVWRVPAFIDRGVYDAKKDYQTGDGVSYRGSFWIAKADSIGKHPGTDASADVWRLAVKSGRDGKDGIKGIDGRDGKDGRDTAVDIPTQGRPW